MQPVIDVKNAKIACRTMKKESTIQMSGDIVHRLTRKQTATSINKEAQRVEAKINSSNAKINH